MVLRDVLGIELSLRVFLILTAQTHKEHDGIDSSGFKLRASQTVGFLRTHNGRSL
jgi:hypothetical protein